MKITYRANNSGGYWWLKDEDWKSLEEAGWNVEWVADESSPYIKADKDGRFLNALATKASKDFETPADAIKEFEDITGQSTMDEGCNCCGPPHSFNWEDSRSSYNYVSGAECSRFIYGENNPSTYREAIEELADLKNKLKRN